MAVLLTCCTIHVEAIHVGVLTDLCAKAVVVIVCGCDRGRQAVQSGVQSAV